MHLINIVFKKRNKQYFLQVSVNNINELIIYLNELYTHKCLILTISKNAFFI